MEHINYHWQRNRTHTQENRDPKKKSKIRAESYLFEEQSNKTALKWKYKEVVLPKSCSSSYEWNWNLSGTSH